MYQPTITRLPSLLCLFLLTLSLIGLTELAIRKLPAHDSSGIVKNVQSGKIDGILADRLVRRLPQDCMLRHVKLVPGFSLLTNL